MRKKRGRIGRTKFSQKKKNPVRNCLPFLPVVNNAKKKLYIFYYKFIILY